jgi:hypothetical protein
MELPEVAATLREYVAASGALQASAAVSDGLVSCADDGAVTLQATADDEPVAIEAAGARAAPLELRPRRLPPFAVDAASGEVSGPLGGLEHVAECLLALSGALGEGVVALAWMPTTDGTQLALSARAGEGVVVVVGDEHYAMEEGWPPGGGQPPSPPTG